MLFFLVVLLQTGLFISAHLNIIYGPRSGNFEAPFFLQIDFLKSYFIKSETNGEVLDGHDMPISYALVEAHSTKGKLLYRTYSNSIGDFRIPHIGNQFYLSCDKFGYKNKFDKNFSLKEKGKILTLRMDQENQIAKDPSVISYLESSRKLWWLILGLGLVALAFTFALNAPALYPLVVITLDALILYFLVTFRYKISVKNSENETIKNFDIEVYNEKNQKIATLKTDKSGNARVLLSEGIYIFKLADMRKSIKIDRRAIINFDFVI